MCKLRLYAVRQKPKLRICKLEQIEQEGEDMKSKCCVGCKWHEEWTWACFNGDSPYCADFLTLPMAKGRGFTARSGELRVSAIRGEGNQ